MKYEIKANLAGVEMNTTATTIRELHDKLSTLRIFGWVIVDVSSKRSVLRLRKIK